jgi:hypothetical protein
VCCGVLQSVAAIAVCCNMSEFPAIVKEVREKVMFVCCGVLRCVAVCCRDCGLLQYLKIPCDCNGGTQKGDVRVLRCGAVRCGALRCVAVHCRIWGGYD